MENKIKYGILIGVIIVLLVLMGIGFGRYNKLEKQFQNLQIEQNEYVDIIDSLSKINTHNLYIIDSISLNINKLEKEIVYINRNKAELEEQLDKFSFQNNLDSAVILLRENIWKYTH